VGSRAASARLLLRGEVVVDGAAGMAGHAGGGARLQPELSPITARALARSGDLFDTRELLVDAPQPLPTLVGRTSLRFSRRGRPSHRA
jgi:hypothetical protein